MNISVVVPLFNEEESLPELCAWIDKVMQANNYTYEVLLIDDGSKDETQKLVTKLIQMQKEHVDVEQVFQFNYVKK